MAKLVDGFDYRLGERVSLPLLEWRANTASALEQGGFRRAENGETFVHDKAGRILFEVYTIVPVRRQP